MWLTGPLRAESVGNPCIFPAQQAIHVGDEFAPDCLHHQSDDTASSIAAPGANAAAPLQFCAGGIARGARNPTATIVARLAATLGVAPGALVDLS